MNWVGLVLSRNSGRLEILSYIYMSFCELGWLSFVKQLWKNLCYSEFRLMYLLCYQRIHVMDYALFCLLIGLFIIRFSCYWALGSFQYICSFF